MMMAETLNFLQNLIPSDSQRHSKDIRYRLTLFLDFLASTNLSLDHPELLIRYRDYLLTERGFAASTVRSHLATIRKLIRTMLLDVSTRRSTQTRRPSRWRHHSPAI